MTALLLKPKILSAKNSISARIFLKRLPFMLFGLCFAVLLYVGSFKILGYVRGIEIIGEAISRKFLSMIFFSLSGFLLLSSTITAISSFYLSKDINLLLTLPVKKTDIVQFKFIETFAHSSWMTASFLPPVFIAYGVSYGAPLGYYLMVGLTLIAFMVIVSAAGSVLCHVFARLLPARGMRDVLLFLSLMIFLLVYFILNPARHGGEAEGLIARIIFLRLESPFLPNYWASEIIWESLSKGLAVKAVYLMALLSTALFALMISSIVGSALYVGNLGRIVPKSLRTQSTYYPLQGRSYPWALLYKDLKVFVRDTAQWSQLVVIGALTLIYVYNFRAVPLESLSKITVFVSEIIILINLLMAGLVMTAVAARFVYPSVSLEGRAFWSIKSAPITMGRFLWAKFLHGFLPLFLVTIVLVLFTNFAAGIKGTLMWMSLAVIAALTVSISGLGTGLGAIYPKFRHESIASVSVSLGGMAFMMASFAVVVFTIALLAWPFYIYRIRGDIGFWQAALPLAVAISINAIAFYLPMQAGIKKLKKSEE